MTRSVFWAHTIVIHLSSKWLMLPEVKTNQLACARTPEADRHVNQAEAQWAVAVMKYKDGRKRVDENSEGTYTPYTPYTFGCSVNFRVCNLSNCSSSARWWTIRVPQKISELYSCLIMFNLDWPILIHFICCPITWPTSEVLLSMEAETWSARLMVATFAGHARRFQVVWVKSVLSTTSKLFEVSLLRGQVCQWFNDVIACLCCIFLVLVSTSWYLSMLCLSYMMVILLIRTLASSTLRNPLVISVKFSTSVASFSWDFQTDIGKYISWNLKAYLSRPESRH